MSDTTGWVEIHETVYEKRIGNMTFLCVEWCGVWWLKIHSGSVTLATRPTPRECQILAHDTARLWAGDGE